MILDNNQKSVYNTISLEQVQDYHLARRGFSNIGHSMFEYSNRPNRFKYSMTDKYGEVLLYRIDSDNAAVARQLPRYDHCYIGHIGGCIGTISMEERTFSIYNIKQLDSFLQCREQVYELIEETKKKLDSICNSVPQIL